MIPIYILIASLSVCVVVALAIAFTWRGTAKDLMKRLDTAEQAYAELNFQSSIRERELLSDLNQCRANLSSANGIITRLDRADTLQVEALQKTSVRLLEVQADADRLAPIVEQFIKDIDDTARLLNDDKAPALTAEREAIRLHQELLKSRTHETAN